MCVRNLFLLAAFLPYLAACDLIGSLGKEKEDEPLFSDLDFHGKNRVILGETLVLATEMDLVSPEIYVGEMRMETDIQKKDGTTVLGIHFPENIEAEMTSGFTGANNTFRIVLKSGIAGQDGVTENAIADVAVYKKTGRFDTFAVGTPANIDLAEAFAVYLDNRSNIDDWTTYGYRPIKITKTGTEPLSFRDCDGGTLEEVRMKGIKMLSDKYLYASLIYPVAIDTVYSDYASGMFEGDAFQNIVTEEKDVLVRISDGALLAMSCKHGKEPVADRYMEVSWISDDVFCLRENGTNEEGRHVEFVSTYTIYESEAYQEEWQEISDVYEDEYYHGIPSLAANETGFLLNENKSYGFGSGSEELYFKDEEGIVRDMSHCSAVSFPSVFTGGDGKFYSILLFGWRHHLCRLEEDVWNIVETLDYAENNANAPIYAIASGSRVYIAGNPEYHKSGEYYVLDKDGNLAKTGYDQSAFPNLSLIPFSNCHNPEYIYYHDSDNGIYRKKISDSSDPEHTLYIFYGDNIEAVNSLCGMFLNADGGYCLISYGTETYFVEGIKGLQCNPYSDSNQCAVIPQVR